jgi:hypothetical protein
MNIIENVKAARQRAKARRERNFILNRDCGCVFCSRMPGFTDEPFHHYLESDSFRIVTDEETGKAYAICDWHYQILNGWAEWIKPEKQNEMRQHLRDYLRTASKPF